MSSLLVENTYDRRQVEGAGFSGAVSFPFSPVYGPGMQDRALIPWLTRWRLTPDGAPFMTEFGSHLMPVRLDDAPAMLKIAGNEEERRGAALMAWFAGHGAARVLAHEGDAILLERMMGGRSLASMARGGADIEATRIICETTARLHMPRPAKAPDKLVPLPAWCAALEPAAARHGGIFTISAAAARELLAEPQDIVVLHGDIHHDNILDGGERGWLAIDPKGLIGERAFDYANLFRNPDVEIALAPGQMRQRVEVVAKHANLEPKRLLTWILAYAGLGAAWSMSAGADPAPGLAIAERAAAELAG